MSRGARLKKFKNHWFKSFDFAFTVFSANQFNSFSGFNSVHFLILVSSADSVGFDLKQGFSTFFVISPPFPILKTNRPYLLH